MKKVLVADNLGLLETKLYKKKNEKKLLFTVQKDRQSLRDLWSCTNCSSKGSVLILICNSADTDCCRDFDIGHNLTYVMKIT